MRGNSRKLRRYRDCWLFYPGRGLKLFGEVIAISVARQKTVELLRRLYNGFVLFDKTISDSKERSEELRGGGDLSTRRPWQL